jgi:hypothetical protein
MDSITIGAERFRCPKLFLVKRFDWSKSRKKERKKVW